MVRKATSIKRPLKMIVKIQRAIITTEEHTPVLAYNQDRSVLMQQEATKAVLGLFKREEYKIFVNAELHPDGQLVLCNRAPTQNW